MIRTVIFTIVGAIAGVYLGSWLFVPLEGLILLGAVGAFLADVLNKRAAGIRGLNSNQRFALGIVILLLLISIIRGYMVYREEQQFLKDWRQRHQSEMKEIEELTGSDETADWQTYHNEQHGFEFKYPTYIKVQTNNDYNLALLNGDKWVGAISTGESTYFRPPQGTNVREWVLKYDFNKYESFSSGFFANKIGMDFPIDRINTVHLMYNSPQAGVYDRFLFIKKDRLYEIQLATDDPQELRNLDLSNSDTWQIEFLRSFKFTK